MNLDELKEKEYLKCVGLLSELIDLDIEAQEKIYQYFKNIGIKNFFLQLEFIGLSPELSDKLNSIKSIIEISDQEGERA